MFDIQENLRILPDKPGVYLYKDAFGEVIYVGSCLILGILTKLKMCKGNSYHEDILHFSQTNDRD